MDVFCNWNGKIVENGEVCISPENRSFKYGDGCFETMKLINGNLVVADLHFERLFSSLRNLKFYVPAFVTAEYLLAQIKELVKVNGHERLARVRLVVYRGDGDLYNIKENSLQFIIQTYAGNEASNYFNPTGLNVDVFTDAKKTADHFSSIKSNNFLGYAMAAMWAKEAGLDDAILTNAFDRVAEATIANVFIVSGGILKTPALTEGCINGVMRRHLLRCFDNKGLSYKETEITIEDMLNASEVFVTNATFGIRWVQKLGAIAYSYHLSALLHKQFIAPLFATATF